MSNGIGILQLRNCSNDLVWSATITSFIEQPTALKVIFTNNYCGCEWSAGMIEADKIDNTGYLGTGELTADDILKKSSAVEFKYIPENKNHHFRFEGRWLERTDRYSLSINIHKNATTN